MIGDSVLYRLANGHGGWVKIQDQYFLSKVKFKNSTVNFYLTHYKLGCISEKPTGKMSKFP